jgi:hypothetical protein
MKNLFQWMATQRTPCFGDFLRKYADEWGHEILGDWPRLVLRWECGRIRGH